MQLTVPRASVGKLGLTAVTLYAGAWGVYYLTTDLLRRRELRLRRARFPLAAQRTVLGSSKAPHTAGPPSATEQAHIRARWGTLRIWGRYCNVTPEWREQGAWEWAAWKLFYSLLIRPRLWWDGGVAVDMRTAEGRRRLEELLPVRKLDGRILWGGSAFSGGEKRPEEAASKAEVVPDLIASWALVDKPLSGAENAESSRVQPAKETTPPSLRPAVLDSSIPAAPAECVTYTWIGQSTCMVQMHGVNVLTDPVFSDKPVESIVSPKRMRPMPCSFKDLKRVDVVLLSHNHFDHLDASIVPLVPRSTMWVVPPGLRNWLVARGIASDKVIELDWWSSANLELELPVRVAGDRVELVKRRMDVTACPASHWTARSPFDTNATLWCSYVARVHALPPQSTSARLPASASFFFCCDTGYSAELFTAIGRALGPVDFAAIPIGSYEPRWHMDLMHTDPEGSVRIARALGAPAGNNFATHWGTWSMSDERWDDPPKDLALALKKHELPCDLLRTVAFGETIEVVVGRVEEEEEERREA